MEQKKNKLLNDMIQNDTDRKMVQLVEEATDLSCGDICILLEVAHSLPFVGNLEGGDTAYKRKRIYGYCPVQTSQL